MEMSPSTIRSFTHFTIYPAFALIIVYFRQREKNHVYSSVFELLVYLLSGCFEHANSAPSFLDFVQTFRLLYATLYELTILW